VLAVLRGADSPILGGLLLHLGEGIRYIGHQSHRTDVWAAVNSYTPAMAEVIEFPDQSSGLVTPWARFIAGFRRTWEPGQHVTVLGKTGSGKSWLERWLLEECRPTGRVILIDVKASDEVLRLGFRTVSGMPSWTQKQLQRMRGGREWLRIVPPTSRTAARRLVGGYMNLAWHKGSTTVVFDEMNAIAGRPPNLGLGEAMATLWRMGRSKHVSVLGGTQSPVWIPRPSLEQIDHLFVGRIADSRRLPLLRDVVGDRGDELMDLVRGIKFGSFQFVYIPPDGPLQMVRAPATMPGAKAAVSGEWGRSDRHRLLYG